MKERRWRGEKLGLGEEGRFPLGLLLFVRRDEPCIIHLLIESTSIQKKRVGEDARYKFSKSIMIWDSRKLRDGGYVVENSKKVHYILYVGQ